jgi:2'-5' RNA ligase
MDVKLFFAVLPPPALRVQIDSLRHTIARARRMRGHVIATERLHNTLLPVPASHQAIARAKAAAATLRAPSFPVRFEWTQSFAHHGHKPFVLSGGDGLAPLRAFQGELRDTMIRAGFPVPSGFTPHITLLWADRCVDEEAPIAPLEWTVRDFTLIASPQGHSRHIHLAHWCLS